ncbi:MFS transporter [Mesomycoplasma neurolyticum]|uniref:Major Facilitator Superfamily n=1 Tax=Mesomycoplasma neurolyticum TaxID=2120 RepID=A0A449A4R9_9BACT|nr:MFS transporter [Mesomycoplasma neurolyticum]VEU59238.1 Uncharacterised protein [Mesomycoplasma neurolyticum]
MKTNLYKYIIAIFISLIGSGAFKLGTSLYMFKFEGNQWNIASMYLLIQIPTLVIYFFSKRISKINSKFSLVISDILSLFLLIISIFLYFLYSKESKLFSILMIIINSLLGFVHAFRFIHLRNILYYCSSHEKEIKKYNYLNSWATTLSFVFFPFISLLFSYFNYYFLIIFNICTYLLSGLLYFSLSLNKKAIVFKNIKNNEKNYSKNKSKWFFTIFFSIVISLILYPKQSGMFQFLKFSNFDFIDRNFSSVIIPVLTSIFGVLGTFISHWLNYKMKSKILAIFCICSFLLVLIGFPWLFIILMFEKNSWFSLIFYVLIISFQQLLFSLLIPIYYNFHYEMFNKEDNAKQLGLSLIFRTLVSSFAILFFTFLSETYNYYYAFMTYLIIILILICFTIYFIIDAVLLWKKKNINNSIVNF